MKFLKGILVLIKNLIDKNLTSKRCVKTKAANTHKLWLFIVFKTIMTPLAYGSIAKPIDTVVGLYWTE